nr:cbb3-type cytochrome oxidase assembly protein CcoS [Nitratireductor luteus]
MGITALLAFLWSLHEGQYEDLDGAAVRILIDEDEDRPLREGMPGRGQARDTA